MLESDHDFPNRSRIFLVNALASSVLERSWYVVDHEVVIWESSVVVLAAAPDVSCLVVGLFVADVVVDVAFA